MCNATLILIPRRIILANINDSNYMKSSFYLQILHQIKEKSGKPTQHTFLDSYLGNQHPRYPISAPVLRAMAKDWAKGHRELSAGEFASLLTELIHGESSTEKCMAGILLDYSLPSQRKFNPKLFDEWLNHLDGWAEVDVVCTNKYTRTELVSQWQKWKPLLLKFSKSKNINKRRASLVFFCSPLSQFENTPLSEVALENINRLKGEKKILITKAISWVLRSMVKYNRNVLEGYLKENSDTLPKIALRETLVKLETGRKTKAKSSGV
jgi:3-methyladenine DNA glycosylase AlkD